MKTVGAYEAKTHLSQLLDDVAAGETITITRHGVPVARLVPPENDRKPSVDEVIEQIREFRRREKISLDGITIRELIEEGRM